MKWYETQTNQNGITYTTEHGTDSNGGGGGGGILLVLMLVGFLVLLAGQLLYMKTGFNFLDAEAWRSL